MTTPSWPRFLKPPPPPPPPPPAGFFDSLDALSTLLFSGLSLGLLAVLVVLAAVRARKTKHTRPRKYRPYTPMSVAHPSGDCTTDAFKPRKLPEEIDYVIIGSGMGSLYCAGLLAKAGHRCVILEQHYVTGGCTHSFQDHGFEFDTGLHYVGRIEKYKLLLDLVSAPGHEVEW